MSVESPVGVEIAKVNRFDACETVTGENVVFPGYGFRQTEAITLAMEPIGWRTSRRPHR